MDHITKKLVQTIHTILTEGAPRGAAAILADMTDEQFEDYIGKNPGTADKARTLRAEGQASRGTSQSHSKPSSETPFANVHAYADPLRRETTEARATMEVMKATTEQLDQLIEHPSRDVRMMVADKARNLSSQQMFKLLQDKNPQVRLAVANGWSMMTKNHLQYLHDTVAQSTSDSDPFHDVHKQILKTAFRRNARLVTPEMFKEISTSPHADIREFAETWSQIHGTGYPEAQESNRELQQ